MKEAGAMLVQNAARTITVFSNNFWFIIRASALSLAACVLSLGLLVPAMTAGMGEIFLGIKKGEKPGFSVLFKHLNKTFQLFALGLIIALASAAGVIFIFLPVVILAFWMYPVFFMACGNKGIGESLSQSAAAVVKYGIFSHMTAALVLLLMNVAGVLLFGLGLFFTFPLTAGFLAYNYEEIDTRE
jgi:hypothetical protein